MRSREYEFETPRMIIRDRKTTFKVVLVAMVGCAALGLSIPLVMSLVQDAGNGDWPKTAGHLEAGIPHIISLEGIWAQSPSMAAGWADRYHFYPSGAFHFIPNQMACPDEKTEKYGTWEMDQSVLSLTVNRTITHTLETTRDGFCAITGIREEVLTQPVLEQYAVKDLGLTDASPYPGISLNGVRFWHYSQDASQYGEEQFPE